MSSGASRRLSQAARPYSVCTTDPGRADEDYGPDSSSSHGKDVWVSADDVTDILLLAGVPVTAASVAQSVRALASFLPGINQGKLCFQVRHSGSQEGRDWKGIFLFLSRVSVSLSPIFLSNLRCFASPSHCLLELQTTALSHHSTPHSHSL